MSKSFDMLCAAFRRLDIFAACVALYSIASLKKKCRDDRESDQRGKKLDTALSAITAAMVGVVLSLAVVFAYHTLAPDKGGFDWHALAAAGLPSSACSASSVA